VLLAGGIAVCGKNEMMSRGSAGDETWFNLIWLAALTCVTTVQ
jgi:hypothetical protein